MPRPDPETLRQDLVRLVAGLDFYRDWRIATARALGGPDHVPDPNELVLPGQFWLDGFDVNPRRGAFWLREVRTWYAVTADELGQVLNTGNQQERAATTAFLDRFRATLGFDFFAEAGALHVLAKRVLTRGRIVNDREHEALTEIVTNTSQSILGTEDRRTLDSLLAAYEKSP